MDDFIRKKFTEIPQFLHNRVENFKAIIDEVEIDEEYDLWGNICVATIGPNLNKKRWQFWKDSESWLDYYEHEEVNLTEEPTEGIVDFVNQYFNRTYGITVPEDLFFNLLDPMLREYRDIKVERISGSPILRIVKPEEYNGE